jgi:hypothetical protein
MRKYLLYSIPHLCSQLDWYDCLDSISIDRPENIYLIPHRITSDWRFIGSPCSCMKMSRAMARRTCGSTAERKLRVRDNFRSAFAGKRILVPFFVLFYSLLIRLWNLHPRYSIGGHLSLCACPASSPVCLSFQYISQPLLHWPLRVSNIETFGFFNNCKTTSTDTRWDWHGRDLEFELAAPPVPKWGWGEKLRACSAKSVEFRVFSASLQVLENQKLSK